MTQENYAKYFITYPKDKRATAQLTSPNSIVGDKFKLEINSKNKQINIKNKFNFVVGKLSEEDSKIVKLWNNKGFELSCFLTYVAYCEPKAQHLSEFLIIAYPKKDSKAYKNFEDYLSNKLSNATRPDIKLDSYERKEILKSNGSFKVSKTLGKPKFVKGTVIVKDKMSLKEKIIEAGRQKKIGCYFASILFLLLIIGLLVLLFSQIVS